MFIVDSKGNCWQAPSDAIQSDWRPSNRFPFNPPPPPPPPKRDWGKIAVIVCLLCVIGAAVAVAVCQREPQAANDDTQRHVHGVPHVMPVVVPIDGAVKTPVSGLKPVVRPPLVKPIVPTFRPPIIRVR